MQKINMELTRITKKIKLRFSLIIEGDNPKENPIMSSFNKDGNRYLTVNPYPYITVDISDKKERPWSPNQSFTLSGLTKFIFVKRLKELRYSIIKEKDLFFTYNGKLCLNKELVEKRKDTLTKLIKVGQNKVCLFMPVVVNDEDDQYEGVSMMINTPDNYANLTFEELEFFIDYLEKLDLENLAINFLNLVVLKSGHKDTTKKLSNIYNGIQYTVHEIKSKLKEDKEDDYEKDNHEES